MRASSMVVAMSLLATALTGCDDAPDSAPETTTRAPHNNTPNLNSANLNGDSLNGITLNNSVLNGITLNGITLNGNEINGITLNGTSFSGTMTVGETEVPVSAVDLAGAEFKLLGEGEQEYVLIFDDIYLDPQHPTGDVYLYDITVYDATHDTYRPLCEVGGQPVSAVPLANLWDPETGDRINKPEAVTFACQGAVLAKCVNWGYRPWATATQCDTQGQNCAQVSLADYHQACTRMARADYCGDGVPHTVNGTLIDVYDGLAPQLQAPTYLGHSSWGVEAEWGPDGATCVGSSLRLQILEDNNIPYEQPWCLAALQGLPDCGEFSNTRPSLVANSYCDAWGTNPSECE